MWTRRDPQKSENLHFFKLVFSTFFVPLPHFEPKYFQREKSKTLWNFQFIFKLISFELVFNKILSILIRYQYNYWNIIVRGIQIVFFFNFEHFAIGQHKVKVGHFFNVPKNMSLFQKDLNSKSLFTRVWIFFCWKPINRVSISSLTYIFSAWGFFLKKILVNGILGFLYKYPNPHGKNTSKWGSISNKIWVQSLKFWKWNEKVAEESFL